jgi:hypothetical protein
MLKHDPEKWVERDDVRRKVTPLFGRAGVCQATIEPAGFRLHR